MTQKDFLAKVAELMKQAPSATVAIPGFGPANTNGWPEHFVKAAAAKPAVKTNGEETANIVESTPFRRVRYSGRPSKAQIADLKAMGAFAHRVVGEDGSQTWYWLVPTASAS